MSEPVLIQKQVSIYIPEWLRGPDIERDQRIPAVPWGGSGADGAAAEEIRSGPGGGYRTSAYPPEGYPLGFGPESGESPVCCLRYKKYSHPGSGFARSGKCQINARSCVLQSIR